MNRRDLLKAGAVAVPAVAASMMSAPAIAKSKDKIEWKLATSFPAKAPGVGTNVTSFAKRVNEMSGGRLTLKVYSGGELVPPFGVENAVQQGTVEIGHSTPYYSASKNSAIHFFSAVPFGLNAIEHTAWLRYGGGQELWNKIYAERGLVPFYSGNSGIQSAGWFKKEIKSLADLSGLNMRIAGLGGEVMRKIGVNAVLLPPPEIFPAFKSGAIDAAEWVGPMLDQAFGLNKVANYCYLPAFHEPSAALEIVVNKEAYDSLPADLQAIIANAAEAVSSETLSQFDYFNTLAFKKLKDSGVIFNSFPDDVISALQKGTGEIMAENAKANPAFAEVQKSYEAYQTLATEYANAMKVPSFQQRV